MKNLRILVGVLLLLPFAVGFAQFEITIDAEKDAYYNTLTGPDDGWLWLPSAAYNDNGTGVDGDEDLSANLYSAWDSTYFYIYENVTDDVVNQNNATEYNNDVFEIKIDPDPFSDDNTVWATDFTCKDSTDVEEEIYAGIDNLYPTGHSWSGTEAPTYADFARKLTDTGYALELRLKWEWICTTNKGPIWPEVGTQFGLAYMNHDNDIDTREGSIEWAAVLKDAAWNDCKMHGTVEFLADHKLQIHARQPQGTLQLQSESGDVYSRCDRCFRKTGHGCGLQARTELSQSLQSENHDCVLHTESRHVTLKAYDVLGRDVASLVDGVKEAGSTQANLTVPCFPAAFTITGWKPGHYSAVRKLTLLK